MSYITQNPYSFQMPNQNTAVTAYFKQETATLTVIADQGGDVVVTINGQSTTVPANSYKNFTVPIGATVTVQAQPESGYQFSGWSVTETG